MKHDEFYDKLQKGYGIVQMLPIKPTDQKFVPSSKNDKIYVKQPIQHKDIKSDADIANFINENYKMNSTELEAVGSSSNDY